jgi:hypothetical protein
VTTIPDWLVERALLDEVAPAMRERLERTDRRELEARVAALRAENEAELAAYPAAAAVALLEGRVAAQAQRWRRERRLKWFSAMSAVAAAAVVIAVLVGRHGAGDVAQVPVDHDEGGVRVKGPARLLAFRQVGERAEQLTQDALVHAGDVLQLRYKPVGQNYGVIASVDGAGVVTLHFPASEDAAPEATALEQKMTALPRAYELDDAPRFERFFFITSDQPIDVQQTLASLRNFARRSDSDSAALELPAGHHQWSLRLRKPDRSSSTNQGSSTP